MKTFALTDEQAKNLIIFLNRVSFQGLTEVEAMYGIMQALASPMIEEKK